MSLRRRLSWLFPVCSLAVGCAAEFPESPAGGDRSIRDNPHLGDSPGGGILASDSLIADGGVPDAGSDGVRVSAQMRYLTASGLETRPGRLSAAPQVLVPQADGTFTTYNGTPDGTGGYVFSGVPLGTYYLKNGTGYIVTEAREVDVGYDLLGRSDAVTLSGVTEAQLDFNLTNLAPWEPGTLFQLATGELDTYGNVYSFSTPPANGATALNGNGELGMAQMLRFEAARGDRAWVNQISTLNAGTLQDGGTLEYSAVTRSIQLPPFSFDGTAPIPVEGTMVAPPPTTFPFEWRVSSFVAQAPAVHPQATPSSSGFYVSPAAHGLANGWIGYSGELLSLSPPTSYTQDLVRRVSFANPYPSTWGVVGQVSHSFRTTVNVPGFNPTSISGYIHQFDQLDRLIASPMTLRLSPPRELTLDGVSAYTWRMVGSASPVIAWKPPAIGAPTAGYTLRLYKYSRASSTSLDLRRTRVASFYVGSSTTQLRLPLGILEPAQNYALEVIAMATPGDLTRSPYRLNRLPSYSASSVTSLFTTP